MLVMIFRKKRIEPNNKPMAINTVQKLFDMFFTSHCMVGSNKLANHDMCELVLTLDCTKKKLAIACERPDKKPK